MWNILKKARYWPIGLDLSADGIRMLQLQAGESRPVVCAGAQWKPACEDSDEDARQVFAVHAVREILDEGQFVGRRVVTAIGSEDLHICNVRACSGEELPFTLLGKAHEAFDFDLSLARLMVFHAGAVVHGGQDEQEYILIAIPTYAIRQRTELLNQMGLAAETIDAEPLALYRAFHRLMRRDTDRGRIITAIHVTGRSTLVVVGQGRRILFVKNIPRGGEHFTRAVAEQLGLSLADAAQLRRHLGDESARQNSPENPTSGHNREFDDSLLWTVHDAVRAEIDALVLDIGLCLRYCSTTFACPEITAAMLSGSEAWDPSLRLGLVEQLGLECDGAWPLRNVDLSQCSIFGDRRGVHSDWTTCMGLASMGEFPVQYDQSGELLSDQTETKNWPENAS